MLKGFKTSQTHCTRLVFSCLLNVSIIWATLPGWLGVFAYVLLWRSWNLSLAIITAVLWDPRNMLYTHEYTHGFYTWFFSICIHISIVVLISHGICLIAIFLVSEPMDAIQVVADFLRLHPLKAAPESRTGEQKHIHTQTRRSMKFEAMPNQLIRTAIHHFVIEDVLNMYSLLLGYKHANRWWFWGISTEYCIVMVTPFSP